MSSLPLSQPLYLNSVSHSKTPRAFHCILIGVGGTDGYVLQALTRLLYGMGPNGSRIAVTLIDGGRVEQHNLKRQHFLAQDIGRNKATVLAERFGALYHLPLHTIPHYLEQAQTIKDLCYKVPQKCRFQCVPKRPHSDPGGLCQQSRYPPVNQ